MTLELSGEQQKELRELIAEVFSPEDLELLVSDHLGMSLDHLVSPGTYIWRVFGLLDACRQRGWLDRLVAGVVKERSQHPKVISFAQRVRSPAQGSWTSASKPTVAVSASGSTARDGGIAPPVARVFISYSHDTPVHRQRVLDLAEKLRGDGVDCQIDHYVLGTPPEGWPLWTERQVAAADYVLVVCTDVYRRRYDGREPPGQGLGATWESILTRQELYESGTNNKKFVPVLFESAARAEIPTPLRSHTYYSIPEDYDALFRYITAQPAVIPRPIGVLKVLPPTHEVSAAGSRSSVDAQEVSRDPSVAAYVAGGAGKAAPVPGASVEVPGWAISSGVDAHGRWATFEIEGVRQRMRWIPAGKFIMGAPVGELGRSQGDELQQEVTLTAGYWLGQTPVTQALWVAVIGINPSHFRGSTREELERPVEQVNWDDCQAFMIRLNERVAGLAARLPTEAEWEFACRGGTTGATWIGELSETWTSQQLDAIAWYNGNSQGITHPVGQKAPNPYGLYDMLGNVWELCENADEPETSLNRVIRGGAWSSHAAWVRAAHRELHPGGVRLRELGFRIVAATLPA